MTSLYPAIEPFDGGMIGVGDGHMIYWEQCGNPAGKPAVVLHGGPGSGCHQSHRRFFDPAVYRIVLFDQRNCGRSTPHASDLNVDLSTNTTNHLIDDIEAVRSLLSIEAWLVFGTSWGSTLALAYAQRHPERVTELVLAAVTTTTPDEINWLYHGARRFAPEAWERFRLGVPKGRRGDLVAGYRALLQSPDAHTREAAAARWCEWEDAVVRIGNDAPGNRRYDDPRFRLAFARIVTHYFHHHAWLSDGQLLEGARTLEGIPGVLVHGALDVSSPIVTAWRLNRAWKSSSLVEVGAAGHSSTDRNTVDAVVNATDRYAAAWNR